MKKTLLFLIILFLASNFCNAIFKKILKVGTPIIIGSFCVNKYRKSKLTKNFLDNNKTRSIPKKKDIETTVIDRQPNWHKLFDGKEIWYFDFDDCTDFQYYNVPSEYEDLKEDSL